MNEDLIKTKEDGVENSSRKDKEDLKTIRNKENLRPSLDPEKGILGDSLKDLDAGIGIRIIVQAVSENLVSRILF